MTTFGAEIPFVDHCGIEAIGIVEGRTRLRMAIAPHHGNHLGMVHGGAICTLLDVAMGTVARTHAGRSVITLDMQVAFLAPGRGVLIGEGRVLRAGRSLVFCEAEVREEESGGLVAKSSGLFKPVPPG